MKAIPSENEQLLRAHDIRPTPARLAVLACLQQGGCMDASAVIAQARRQGIDLAQSSAYRTLDLMVQNGLVTAQFTADGQKKLYALHTHAHHHHLVCTRCHKIVEVPDCPIAEYQARLARQTGFAIQDHHLELHGICGQCQAAQRDTSF